jgi:hypothetical protein
MKALEKLGKTAWISYLIGASPVALFLAAMWIVAVFLSFRENHGPLEGAPSPFLERIVMMSSFIVFPVVWFLGIAIAHRFNAGRLVIIPFVANILPLLGLFWFAVILTRDEGRDFSWTIYYTGFLVVLLILGIVCVIFSIHLKSKAPNKARMDNPH